MIMPIMHESRVFPITSSLATSASLQFTALEDRDELTSALGFRVEFSS